jgi:hypothetical protein
MFWKKLVPKPLLVPVINMFFHDVLLACFLRHACGMGILGGDDLRYLPGLDRSGYRCRSEAVGGENLGISLDGGRRQRWLSIGLQKWVRNPACMVQLQEYGHQYFILA